MIRFVFFNPPQILAQTAARKPHYTLIINQVRGDECCEPGSVETLKQQLNQLEKHNLNASFVLRFDALGNPEVTQTLINSPHQIGGYLEIIPGLAEAAGVEYQAQDHNWYQAQHAYLIGYSQQERQQLIDAFMQRFKSVFGVYPHLTTAWMIDPWSLQYLKQEYQVNVHQITREQFGTDSYTLYGGPAHYPYWPTDNWALMLQIERNQSMPLIVRQTIMDPVYNYGDTSNSYTSQPNDYLLRDGQTEYFVHLFNQAHQQLQPNFTFALLGLETSMEAAVQQEFFKQLEIVSDWDQQSSLNQVVSATEFFDWYQNNYQPLLVYSGQNQTNRQERAWWISTAHYRARVRLSNQQLFISDLRLFMPEIKDPYFDKTARMQGWWITPFVLDGSRFFTNLTHNNPLEVRNDYLVDREAKYGEPARVELETEVKLDQLQVELDQNKLKIWTGSKLTAVFEQRQLCLDASAKIKQPQNLTPINHLKWSDQDQQPAWGFESEFSQQGLTCYQPFLNSDSFSQQRQVNSQLLFPEVKSGLASASSRLVVSNQFAGSGRNPVRLVFYPRNDLSEPVFLAEQPVVVTQPQADSVTMKPPHPQNGMIFIDVEHDQPAKINLKLQSGEYQKQVDLFFAPACKQRIDYCLTHPRQAWWFVRNWWGDKSRARQRQKDAARQFVD